GTPAVTFPSDAGGTSPRECERPAARRAAAARHLVAAARPPARGRIAPPRAGAPVAWHTVGAGAAALPSHALDARRAPPARLTSENGHRVADAHRRRAHGARVDPEQRVVLACEPAQELGPLLARVRVARRDRAALARVQQLELGLSDAQAPALPALLGERSGVELDVQVRAEAAQ